MCDYLFVFLYTEKLSQKFFHKNDSESCLGNSFYFLKTDHPETLKAQQATTHKKFFSKEDMLPTTRNISSGFPLKDPQTICGSQEAIRSVGREIEESKNFH